MSRNLKKDYLKKLLAISTSNGYKIDLNNYIYNPAHDHEYPSLRKVVEDTPDHITISEVLYFKYYNGTGEYIHKVFTAPKSNDTWSIVDIVSEAKIEDSNRFNLSKLVSLAEAI